MFEKRFKFKIVFLQTIIIQLAEREREREREMSQFDGL